MEDYEKDIDGLVLEEGAGSPEVPESIKKYVMGQEYFKDPTSEKSKDMVYALGTLKASMDAVIEYWDVRCEESPELFTEQGLEMVKDLVAFEKSLVFFPEHPVGKAVRELLGVDGEAELSQSSSDLINYALNRLSYLNESVEKSMEEDHEKIDESELN